MKISKKSLSVGSTLGLVGGASGALLAGLLAGPAAATGTTYIVDTLADGAAVGTDCSTPVANSCSLRDALAVAVGGDTIAFASELSGTITIDANEGDFDVVYGLTIAGSGASALTIDADGNSRIFYVCSSNGAPTISGMTMTGGVDSDGGAILEDSCDGLRLESVAITGNDGGSYGGAIYGHNSDIWIFNSTITNNVADTYGGGIYVGGNLVVEDSVISGNSLRNVGDGGGGVWVYGPTVSILRSEISGNTTLNNGGGLYVASDNAEVTIIDSTIADNTAGSTGGGLFAGGVGSSVLVANSTITGNQVTGDGGGIFSSGANLRIAQSTIVGNSAGYGGGIAFTAGYDVSFEGTIISGNTATVTSNDLFVTGQFAPPAIVNFEGSLVGDISASITAPGAGNILSTTPGVSPLANNGGSTRTMALLPSSAAIDAGPNPVPTFPLNANDQRGTGYPRVVGGRVDIGAFEVQPPPAPIDPVIPMFTG